MGALDDSVLMGIEIPVAQVDENPRIGTRSVTGVAAYVGGSS